MIVALTHVDWTQVLIVGVPAYIAALGAAIAAVIAAINHRNMKTPSGDSIGTVVERTHDLSAVTTAAATGISGPLSQRAVERLNGGIQATGSTP